MKHLFKIIFFLVFGFYSQAQEILTLEDAVKMALENNYDIKIAKNNLKIDETNSTAGNAGMLPSVNATVVNNNSILNTSQTQATGEIRTLDNAKNFNLTYGIGLDWTIFDGMRMFARREQLKVLQQQGEAELKLAILTKVSDVYTTYFDLVQQQQQIKALDTAIVISKQRLTTAQNRYSIGKSSKLEVLNAQVDLNTDSSSLLKQIELYQNSKIRLNEILARNSQTVFKVEDGITIDASLKYEELKTLSEKQNPLLQAQLLEKNNAELQLKQIKSERYPVVRINSGYNFARSEASLGFISQSQSRGLVYGINASVPIFNGFNQNRNEKVAKLQLENVENTINIQKNALESQLSTAFQSYQTYLELTKVEETNVEIAKQNLDITLAKFKIGTITPIEYRTAQLNYVNAIVRFSDAQFQSKLYEISLKELSGTLRF